MFNNRSFAALALLATLAIVTFIFATGIGSVPVAPNGNAAPVQVRAESSGWVYRYDALKHTWYAQHSAMTPTGLVIDEDIELENVPSDSTIRPRP